MQVSIRQSTRRLRSVGAACAALLCSAVLLAPGCGGSSGSGNVMLAPSGGTSSQGTPSSACGNNCGTAMVTLTDAPGDFISYIVNVVSLQLKRADGTVVETLPVTTQVDFAQLVNLSEIISAAQVPAGQYVSASITLDYSGATIVVDNGTSGVTIAPGNIINGATSLPLAAPNPTQLTLTLMLDPNHSLLVTQNSIANLALDFNLSASDTIAPSATDPTTVTVNPIITGSLVPDTTKSIDVRGALTSVNASAGSYVINVRPFYDASGSMGELTVETSSATTYNINGVSYTGSAGLTQLATSAAGTLVAAGGTWNQTTQTFAASSVLAGSSVPGGKLDSVQGTVLSRSANVLTIADGLVLHAGFWGLAFMREVAVTVGPATTVSESGQSGKFSIADISVGQHVQIFGSFSMGSSGIAALDATGGSAQLAPTTASGTVSATAAGLATLSLQSLDGRPASSFNFAGTGTASAQDASGAAYTVALPAALTATPLAAGVPAMFSGFVSPFGTAPPDFTASSLVSYANTRAALEVRWAAPGDATPFANISTTQLLISQATLMGSAQHVIRIAFETLDPSTLASGIDIVPDATAANPGFAINHWQSWSTQVYGSFADFEAALMSDLNGTTTALQLSASGPYTAATGVMSIDRMTVTLND